MGEILRPLESNLRPFIFICSRGPKTSLTSVYSVVPLIRSDPWVIKVPWVLRGEWSSLRLEEELKLLCKFVGREFQLKELITNATLASGAGK